MKRIFWAGLLIGMAAAAVAAEPVKVIMATTDDGRRVILMTDGQWHFVEGAAPAPKPEAKPELSRRDQAWSEILAYFSAWELEPVKKNSGVLQTQWKVLPSDNALPPAQPVRVKVKVTLENDLSVKVETRFQTAGPKDKWGSYEYLVDKPQVWALLPQAAGGKRAAEFDAKIKADLQALGDQYRAGPK